jgi:serine/threonine protein kinase
MISTLHSKDKYMSQSSRGFPSTLNGYVLGRELGEGAFGKVFQAYVKDDAQKLKVAIKTVSILLMEHVRFAKIKSKERTWRRG